MSPRNQGSSEPGLWLDIKTILSTIAVLVSLTVTGTVWVLAFMHSTTDALNNLSARIDASNGSLISRPAMSAWIQDANKLLQTQAREIQTRARVNPVVLPDISRYPNSPSHGGRKQDEGEARSPVIGEPSRRRVINRGEQQASY